MARPDLMPDDPTGDSLRAVVREKYGEAALRVATGVTSGDMLRGVRYRDGGVYTQSIVMRSKSGTVRVIDSYHRLEKLARYSLVDFD